MPKRNAFDLYVTAGRQMQVHAQLAHLEHLSPAQQAILVEKNTPALKTLRQGLSLPYQPPPARSINDKFPFYQQQRDLARLLAAESHVKAAHGDWRGAVNSNLDSIELGIQVVHGSPLIGCLVGLACQAIGHRPLWAAVGHLNAADARAACRRLQVIQNRQMPFGDTMQEEQWFGQAAYQEYLDSPNIKKYPTFLKSIALSDYTQYMDQAVANARQSYAAHLAEPVPPRGLVSNVVFPLSVIFLPVFNDFHLREADNRTQNSLLTVALALRAYRLEHGAYPATFSSLVPSYLPAIPSDPFALSGPLHYRRTKSGFVLYSVGPDGQDNGGTAVFDTTKPAPTALDRYDQRRIVRENSRGDIVAGVNP